MGVELWEEMCISRQCHKNFYEACKGYWGSVLAVWLKGQALKILCWNCGLGSASYRLSILRKVT